MKIIVWITGVKRDDGKFELPDGHLLDDISTDDFPRWGSNQPSSNPSETRLQLTTIPSYSPNGSNSDKLFYFRTADPSSKAGYICEKPGKIYFHTRNNTFCSFIIFMSSIVYTLNIITLKL